MDNATAHPASAYDSDVPKTIPYIRTFHGEILKFVRSLEVTTGQWLDTGCGTGTFVDRAVETFPGVEFTLSDPSSEMLRLAKAKLAGKGPRTSYSLADTGSLTFDDGRFDIITAIQSHHYLSPAGREVATRNCLRMLKANGVFVTFENIRPQDELSTVNGLSYWKQFQVDEGKSPESAEANLGRFGKEYFPLTVLEHLSLYRNIGFRSVDLFWKSYLQAGFVCIK